jgi:hypothetical protein
LGGKSNGIDHFTNWTVISKGKKKKKQETKILEHTRRAKRERMPDEATWTMPRMCCWFRLTHFFHTSPDVNKNGQNINHRKSWNSLLKEPSAIFRDHCSKSDADEDVEREIQLILLILSG